MSNAVLSKGTLILGSAVPWIFSDFANDAYLNLEFGNALSERVKGRGGSIITKNSNSDQATLTIRLNKGSGDDLFLEGIASDYEQNPEAFVLMSGAISLRFGDGAGEVTTLNYTLSEGSFINRPNFSSNHATSVEDGVSVWTLDVTAVRSFA